MPKKKPFDRLDAVARILEHSPNGAALAEVGRKLKPPAPRRTLQRWLAALVEQERVRTEGKARAARYRLASPLQPLGVSEDAADYSGVELNVSPEAREVRAAIRRPRHLRRPAGYRRQFLNRYRPKETFYLPEKTRKHLAAIGTAPGAKLPAGTHARRVLDRLLIDLSWNSSRLEGNTYSLLETERLLQEGKTTEGRNAREARMILNHKRAIELLVDQAAEIGFNRYTVLNLHALLADGLLADPKAGGRLRSIPVGIDGTVFHPLENPQLLEEYFDQFLATAAAIADPFEQAFFAMVQLPYLQPFEDVNKRVSRLAANIPFIRLNLSPLSFVDVPERDYIEGVLGVYELNRIELLRDLFVWAYERSCARYPAVRRSLGEPDPFRERYRQSLTDLVGEVVRKGMDKRAAAIFVRRQAEKLASPGDHARLAALAESELSSLHEGNFARFRLRPAEYQAWSKNWR